MNKTTKIKSKTKTINVYKTGTEQLWSANDK